MRRGGIIILVGVLGLVALLLAGSAGAFPPEGPSAQGGAPTLISYQGRLTDPSSGNPVSDGNYSMTFKIYDAQSGGTEVWSETQTVGVSAGLFNVLLGSDTALSASVFSSTSRCLEVRVGGETLSPRQRMASVAYALQAEEAANADLLDGHDTSYFQRRVSGTCAAGSSIRVISSGGSVTCEPDDNTTYSAGNQLNLVGTTFNVVEGAGSGLDADLLDGQHASAFAEVTHNHDDAYLNDDEQEIISAALDGILLTVNNTGTGSDVYGLMGLGEDRGVYGYSSGGTGVYGKSYGSGGTGVYGKSDGRGVFGSSQNGWGVYAESGGSGLPLRVGGYSGTNLIEALDYGITTPQLRFKVERSTGNVYIDGTFYDTGADFAEMMATSEGVTYEPGDLLVIGPDGKPLPSSAPNATNLLGVYSTDPGFVGGVGDDGDTTGKIPVAIMGMVPVKASAENGGILPGDLLSSSSTPGHAMKASPVTIDGITFYLPSTVLGKALEPLEEGRGVILVLVTLQ